MTLLKKTTIVFLSTYPPRECGIATFTQDLLLFCQRTLGIRIQCKVAALNLSSVDTYKYPPEVEWQINQNSQSDYIKFAKIVNNDSNISGVIIQHEYGIFGDGMGKKVISFMENCKKPVIVTLHTVLPNPKPKMLTITKKIIDCATTVIVLTNKSKEIIERLYPDAINKIAVIPHGIHETEFILPEKYKGKLELNNRIVLSTFGLLSEGKGIDYVIAALPPVIKKYPGVLYLVLGETHPVIRRREGEKYRNKLSQQISKLGLEKHVKFYDQYLSLADLFKFLKATDIYIATSTSPNQAVSGTFSYALGSGRAVISTEFAQAKEIITPEVGKLVPIRNSKAMTAAILDMLANKHNLENMHRKAYEISRPMLWRHVAEKYIELLSKTVSPPIKLNHLNAMTDDFGLFQFAKYTTPNKEFGYTLDDNARAFIACCWLLMNKPTKNILALAEIYFRYMTKCQVPDGTFINYIGYEDKKPTLQNKVENLDEAQSRALWALSEGISNDRLPQSLRDTAKRMFLLHLSHGTEPIFPRSRAFTIKSYALAAPFIPEKKDELMKKIVTHANKLIYLLEKNASPEWYWFENNLSYNNGLLPEALFVAGDITGNADYTNKAINSLQFLINETFSYGMYHPIGHSNWYKKNKKRSTHDQQPEDPASMILSLAAAYKSTHNEMYKTLARTCISWFHGNNTLNKPVYDEVTGGCHDGIEPDKVNMNEGAESLVSYLMANITVKNLLK